MKETRLSVRLPRAGLLVSLVMALMLLGCGDKLDPTEPEGAYNAFKDALFKGNPDAMWARMSPSSHQYFDDQLERLHRMDAKIERYLPPTDHRLAKKQAGSILTDELESGEEFFKHIFSADTIPQDEKYKVGMQVEEIKISEDEKQAAVVTRGGQEILLEHGEGDQWFVMFVESSEAVPNAMSWLEQNESALDQTVEDLIAEEREERAQIISDLFGYEAPDEEDKK